uniref:Uncharacterized protein n=1 Tax=Meloidogyne enterolobii TaxID=390850 RepID=A0A6V7Y3I2_MELEN|nr:unnamed protein product [Meloidogyne enterolobii]
MDEFLISLRTLGLEMLFITETWLKDEDINLFEFKFSEYYNIVYINRKSKLGGGCAILLSRNITFYEKVKISKFNTEIICLQINNFKKLNIILLYRPPNTSYASTKSLFKYIETLCTENCIILGDLNFGFKDLSWFNFTPYAKSKLGECFIDFFNRNTLTSVTHEPSRNNSFLDLILITNQNLVSNVLVEGGIFSSDHETLLFDINCPISKQNENRIKKRFYNKNKISNLNPYLSLLLKNTIYTGFLIGDKYNIIAKSILNSFDIFIPEQIITKKDRRIKYPAHLKASIAEKKRLYRLQKINKEYKSKYDSISLYIRIAIKNFISKQQNKIISNNPLNVYKYVNKVYKNNRDIPVILYEDKVYIENSEKAELFAEIFHKNFNNFNSNVSRNDIIASVNSDTTYILNDIDVTSIEVYEILKALPSKNSASPDGINYLMLKNISIILAPYLSELFRASLDEGIIPDIWKKSLVIPSFKKGEKSNPLNYRPISLTCCSCRIMEKILVKNIINFLENKKFFSSDQFGFIRRRSTTLQLVSSLEDWYEALFEKKNIDCIYIDFCKAFDSVPHKLLLDKLYACGIRGKLHRWISEFLSNRTYQVKN